MEREELHKVAQSIFGYAMLDAAREGETVMEDGRDEHAWQTMSAEDLLRTAASYFDSVR